MAESTQIKRDGAANDDQEAAAEAAEAESDD